MDLETRVVKGVMEPICISWGDQDNITTIDIRDFDNPEQMIISAVSGLLIKKYSNYKIYIHNFSKFDAMFMLRPLSSSDIEMVPIIRDGRIIKLQLTYPYPPPKAHPPGIRSRAPLG